MISPNVFKWWLIVMTVHMPLRTKSPNVGATLTSFDLNRVRLSPSRKVLRAFKGIWEPRGWVWLKTKLTFGSGSSSIVTSGARALPVVWLLRVNDITAEEFYSGEQLSFLCATYPETFIGSIWSLRSAAGRCHFPGVQENNRQMWMCWASTPKMHFSWNHNFSGFFQVLFTRRGWISDVALTRALMCQP